LCFLGARDASKANRDERHENTNELREDSVQQPNCPTQAKIGLEWATRPGDRLGMDDTKTQKSAGKTPSGCRTAPLKPTPGLNGPPVGHLPDLRWPWCSGPSPSEIIAHDQAENEPTRAERALQRTADLRFSDTRIVAHRNFNYAESGQGAF
jgi:hypothetical protein